MMRSVVRDLSPFPAQDLHISRQRQRSHNTPLSAWRAATPYGSWPGGLSFSTTPGGLMDAFFLRCKPLECLSERRLASSIQRNARHLLMHMNFWQCKNVPLSRMGILSFDWNCRMSIGESMMAFRVRILPVLMLVLASCGNSSVAPKTANNGVLQCAITYTGHGIDTENYSISCVIHDAVVTDTSYQLTGNATFGSGRSFTYSWCKAALTDGQAQCTGSFVFIVPNGASSIQVIAQFQPSGRTLQQTVSVPAP
jgi:hypothetical protein